MAGRQAGGRQSRRQAWCVVSGVRGSDCVVVYDGRPSRKSVACPSEVEVWRLYSSPRQSLYNKAICTVPCLTCNRDIGHCRPIMTSLMHLRSIYRLLASHPALLSSFPPVPTRPMCIETQLSRTGSCFLVLRRSIDTVLPAHIGLASVIWGCIPASASSCSGFAACPLEVTPTRKPTPRLPALARDKRLLFRQGFFCLQ